eukprot:gene34412-42440_t
MTLKLLSAPDFVFKVSNVVAHYDRSTTGTAFVSSQYTSSFTRIFKIPSGDFSNNIVSHSRLNPSHHQMHIDRNTKNMTPPSEAIFVSSDNSSFDIDSDIFSYENMFKGSSGEDGEDTNTDSSSSQSRKKRSLSAPSLCIPTDCSGTSSTTSSSTGHTTGQTTMCSSPHTVTSPHPTASHHLVTHSGASLLPSPVQERKTGTFVMCVNEQHKIVKMCLYVRSNKQIKGIAESSS